MHLSVYSLVKQMIRTVYRSSQQLHLLPKNYSKQSIDKFIFFISGTCTWVCHQVR